MGTPLLPALFFSPEDGGLTLVCTPFQDPWVGSLFFGNFAVPVEKGQSSAGSYHPWVTSQIWDTLIAPFMVHIISVAEGFASICDCR